MKRSIQWGDHDKVPDERLPPSERPPGPWGHSVPVGWRLVDSDKPEPVYERERP